MSESTRVDRLAEAVRGGVDLAKRIIQVHAVDATGRTLCSRSLPRDKLMLWCAQLPPGCRVVMEVSSSAHHWARKLQTLGREPRIVAVPLPAPHRSEAATAKNDAKDAEPGRSQSGGLVTPAHALAALRFCFGQSGGSSLISTVPPAS